MIKRNTSGLHKHAQKKRDLAKERTELAIQKLLKQKKSINFGTVAQEAGVSRTWLYNQTKLRERIESLREKQPATSSTIEKLAKSQKDVSSKLPEQKDLHQKIQKLETENLVLRQHLEVVYGMADDELVKTIERLTLENSSLKNELQELNIHNATIISDKLNRQLQEQIDALEIEKAELLLKIEKFIQQTNDFNSLKEAFSKQTDEIKLLQSQLESAKESLITYQQMSTMKNQKINMCESTLDKQPHKTEINEEFKKQLHELGINLNSGLTKLILSKSSEQVVNALSLVKDYVAKGSVKKSKAVIFRQALEENEN